MRYIVIDVVSDSVWRDWIGYEVLFGIFDGHGGDEIDGSGGCTA